MVAAEQAGYEQGTLTLDVLLEAQALRAELKLALLRMGGKLPKAKDKQEGAWALPPGEMPEPNKKLEWEENLGDDNPAR
jgi:hypothetical protein